MSRKITVNEGMVKKGGVNPRPSTPRPPEPPKAQSPTPKPNSRGHHN